LKKNEIVLNADEIEGMEGLVEKAVKNSLPKSSMVSREKDRKFLKYKFSKEELRFISEELARAVNEKDDVESELKSIKSQFDSRKKLAEEAITKFAKQISSGYEYRNVDVEIVKDFTVGTVTTWRLDTDEIVETRRMTGSDRQMRIDDGKENM
jgi:hypothetical protein